MTRISTVEERIDRLERKVERKMNLLLWISVFGILIKLIVR